MSKISFKNANLKLGKGSSLAWEKPFVMFILEFGKSIIEFLFIYCFPCTDVKKIFSLKMGLFLICSNAQVEVIDVF